MEIIQEKNNDTLKLIVKGKLDTTTSPQLEAVVLNNLEGVSTLEFDLSELVYISSAGLRVLLNSQKEMNKRGTMIVSHANTEVKEIFDITGFSDILTIVD